MYEGWESKNWSRKEILKEKYRRNKNLKNVVSGYDKRNKDEKDIF